MKKLLLLYTVILMGLISKGQPKLLSPDKTLRIEVQAAGRLR